MTYGYDEIVPVPVVDLYDTQMMSMALNAAKDMYEKGEQQIKDFKTQFGDFVTPILADLNWYNQNVTGKVRDELNQMYARGGDPLRNALDRARVSMLINNMPYGEIAKLKSSAANANEYLKARRDLIANDKYDPDFENFRLNGNTIDNWDTVNGGGIWQETSPAQFKDMNTWTHHLFDNMELSYDPELSKKYPGYMAYSKNRDTMNKIVDNNIAELLNTNLGKYYMNDVIKSIPADFQGDRRQEALRRFRDRVIDANWEESQVKLESDPYALARYQNSLAAARLASRGGSGRQQSQDLSYNYLSGLFQRGITTPFGYNRVTGGEQAIKDITKNQITFGQSLASSTPLGPWQAYNQKSLSYVNKFTIWESPMMFAPALARPTVTKTGGVYMTEDDRRSLMSQEDVVTGTYGYPSKRINTDNNKVPKAFSIHKQKDEAGNDVNTQYNIIMEPYRDVYTAYRKEGNIQSQWKVRLIDEYDGSVIGDYWYNLPIETEYNMDVPNITEWALKNDGAHAPLDNEGNERGQAKVGVNQREAGMYETSSLQTNKAHGVTKHDLDRNVSFNWESISQSPF